MIRNISKPRYNYSSIIEELGFDFHLDYWKEDSYYALSEEDVERIHKATESCYKMYCELVEEVISKDLWDDFNIPRFMVPAIIRSWEEDDLSLYGRFDFAFDNLGNIKLLEFNADTPTSLFESSVVQWQWKEDVFPNNDQYNNIHEYLVQSWKDIHKIYKYDRYDFSCIEDIPEETTTTSYIASTAQEAGLNISMMDLRELVRANDSFYLPDGPVVNCMFKLYPWEDMFREEFGEYLPTTEMLWIEPMWKSIMSNKMSLVYLYEMYSSSPYLVPAYKSKAYMKNYCKKPLFGREGSNVTLVRGGSVIEETKGDYGDEGYIFQDLIDIMPHEGKYPIIGSWVIGGEPAGIGIRETEGLITNDMSNFIPHIIL